MSDPLVRQPPQSIESEQAVLGGLMLRNDHWPDVSEIICSDDFYREDHRLVFAEMAALLDGGEPVDFVTLSERLRQRGKADVADLSYLGMLANDTPSAANTIAYARNVRQTSIRRQLIRAGQEIADNGWRAETAEAGVDAAQARVMAIGEESAADMPTDISESVQDWMSRMESRSRGEGPIALSWGLKDLDDKTGGGLRPGDACFILGRPAMGKTALALNVADRVAAAGGKVLFFSLEMPRDQLIDRVMAARANVELGAIRDPRKLHEHQWGEMARVAGTLRNIIVDDRPGLNINQIRARARRVSRSHDLALIVVDYFQLMRGTGEENRTRDLDSAAQGIKELAKELKLPIIVPTQVGRDVERRQNKRPNLGDARDCGNIEQAADIIAAVYRPSVYDKSAPKTLAEALFLKQRNGETGEVRLSWLGAFQRFEMMVRDDEAWEWTDVESRAKPRQFRGGFDGPAAAAGGVA